MMIREILAKNLKYYREKNGFTVYEVGEIVGKSGKTISAWEVGRGQPDADMLIKLCKIYNVNSIADLYGEEDKFIQSFTDKENYLISLYRKLNSEGKERLIERAEELITLGHISSEKRDEEKMA